MGIPSPTGPCLANLALGPDPNELRSCEPLMARLSAVPP
jgi:hypothetical protein